MFTAKGKESFPQIEERILDFWKKEQIFEKSLEKRKNGPLYSFYDGPPFATGLPHYGHILAGTLKDVIPRYKTMKGFYVPRRFGWDCHGLPVENEIEKGLQLSGSSSIEEYGIAKFNQECQKIVLRYTQQWETTVERIGRWVDFKHTYRTMDKDFMESVWWVFDQLYKKGLVYEGFKVMPFSAKLGTPLSNFEANLNYKDVDDPSLTVIFPLKEDPHTALLAWTTTPWTLPSNLALMVSPKIEYVKVKSKADGKNYILAEKRLSSYFKSKEDYERVAKIEAAKLQGLSYQPLFPYFISHASKKVFTVILEDSLEAEEGTGIVHAAPAFGELDFYACMKMGIEPVCPVDKNGRFTIEVPEFKGVFVKDADKDIIRRLKQEGRVFHHSQIRHRYPFCWRSDTPLIYMAVSTWFVSVEQIKDIMLAANDQIHWIPDHIKGGRFGKWLENARDWAISRNRFWGTPIPLWKSEEGDILCFGSVKELEEQAKRSLPDIHRQYIDDIVIEKGGKKYHRVPEVFDCWFESGSMPYAQDHFPFENKEKFLKAFPADFIAEGLDQTRGWFYTLTVLAAALLNKPAFKNVIVNGIVLAEDGNKMSKRLKNYPEPEQVINRFGADALRLYLTHSPAVYGEDVRFSEKGVEQILRQVLLPLWNAQHFLATYATIYHWKPKGLPSKLDAEIDRWQVSVTQKLVLEVEKALDAYELNQAVIPLTQFIEELTNWYIRRCRSRFWSDRESKDRSDAFETLYYSLKTFAKVAAPFIPFITDALYQELRIPEDPLSVHLADFPKHEENIRDTDLEHEMSLAQEAVSLGHSLRKDHKLKVRQPLALSHVISSEKGVLEALKKKEKLILDELNVKAVEFHDKEEGFVEIELKPNFRVLGKKVGKLMPQMQKKLSTLSAKEIKELQSGSLSLEIEGETFTLTQEDITVERKVKEGIVATSKGSLTIALETQLSQGLIDEGIAREIVNKINTMRKEQDFEIVDRIEVILDTTEPIRKAFDGHYEYITHEVLATKVSFGKCIGSEWEINEEKTCIAIRKV